MDEFHKVEGFVENICEEYSIYNNYFSNILVSISEAFNNAVVHGNKSQADKNVDIQFENPPSGLMFKVQDEGEGFDPSAVVDPFSEAAINTDAGTGLYLMRTLSDELSFENNANTVCLLFKVGSINKELSERRTEKLKAYLHSGVRQRHHL